MAIKRGVFFFGTFFFVNKTFERLIKYLGDLSDLLDPDPDPLESKSKKNKTLWKQSPISKLN